MTQTKAELLQTRHQGDLKLGDADSSHYVGFKAPATVGTSLVWTLPAADGSANQFLQTNASGVLGWGTADVSSAMPLSGGTFTGDVTFQGAGHNVVWDKSDNALEFADNARAFFGAGSDLQIYHNNHNFITSTNGDLLLQAPAGNWFYVKTDAGNDNSIIAKNNGAVELYHNNVKKFETSAAGVSITGAATISTNLTVTGDLTVSGTTTTINTQTLDVEDKNVVIGKVSSPSDTTADGGGWTLKGATDKTFNWVNATDAWTSSEHIHVPDNKRIYLGGASGTFDGVELYHDGNNSYIKDMGTGELFIDGGAVNLKFGGNTKLTTTSGGINVTGALTVNGSPLSSAPTVDLVADGAIAANKPVAVQSDGKIKEIKEFAVSAATGSDTILDGSQGNSTYMNDSCKIDDRKFVVTWVADNDSDKLWAACGTTTSSGAITIGSPTLIASNCRSFTHKCAYDPVSAALVVIWINGTGGSAKVKLRAASISGTALTFGTEVSQDYGSAAMADIESDRKGGFIAWWSKGNQAVGQGLTVSGTTITVGSQNTNNWGSSFTTSSNNCMDITYQAEQDRFIFASMVSGGDIRAWVVTRSGTDITVGSANGSLSNAGSLMIRVQDDPDTGNVFCAFRDGGNGVKLSMWTINGTTITDGSLVTLSGPVRAQKISLDYNAEENKCILLVSQDGGNSIEDTRWTYITNGSGTPSIGSWTVVWTYLSAEQSTVSYLGKNNFIVAGQKPSSGETGYGKVYQGAFTDSTLSTGYIGYSSAAISDTATGTISIVGNTNSSQSGLTAGSKQYVTRTGGLSNSAATPSVEAGTAVSATKIIIKG
jgi:hypothetical protein